MKRITIGSSVYFKITPVEDISKGWNCPICDKPTRESKWKTEAQNILNVNSIRDMIEQSITGNERGKLCAACNTSLSNVTKKMLDGKYGNVNFFGEHSHHKNRFDYIEEIAEKWITIRYEKLFTKEAVSA